MACKLLDYVLGGAGEKLLALNGLCGKFNALSIGGDEEDSGYL